MISMGQPLSKTDAKTLHFFVLGLSKDEIAENINRSERTLNESLRKLFRYFQAPNEADLIQKAIRYGYCPSLVESLHLLRKSVSNIKLTMWEIIVLHMIVQGKTEQEIKDYMHRDALIFQKVLQSLREKLEINRDRQFIIKALIYGYVRLKPHDFEEDDNKIVSEKVKRWISGESNVLEVIQYDFEFFYSPYKD